MALSEKFGSESSLHSKKDLMVTATCKHPGQEFYSNGKKMLRVDERKMAINTDGFISNVQH